MHWIAGTQLMISLVGIDHNEFVITVTYTPTEYNTYFVRQSHMEF